MAGALTWWDLLSAPALGPGPGSEIELGSQFEQSSQLNGCRTAPRRSVRVVPPGDRARIEDVECVDHPLEARASNLEDLAETKIELRIAVLVHGIRVDQVDDDGAVAGQPAPAGTEIASQGRSDLGIGVGEA